TAFGINNDTQDENLGQCSSTGPTVGASRPASVSFATLLKGELIRKGLNFRTLITHAGNEADVAVSLESIRVVSEQYVNSAYGFFLGKRVAYPVIAKYVRNTGLVKSMLNSSTGLFFFQFSSMDGLDSMLKNGPWFIRNNPLILKKWNPYVNLMKEYVGNVPVWVKLHGFPMNAFSEDGLSAIATKLDTPLMLDSYTSDMCIQS
ncbi:putative reverse transcriptase domain-containing protein, partial [Tanacetum coccineum]